MSHPKRVTHPTSHRFSHFGSPGFVTLVSKDGTMLLNVVQYPDGSLPPEPQRFLEEMAAWMAINSEAIHGTRPWHSFGEGPTRMETGHFKEDFPFTAQDIRFTAKADALYAITLGVPDREIRMKSLGKDAHPSDKPISDVRLLGSADNLTWAQEGDALVLQVPAKMPCDHSVAFQITFER